MLFNDFLNEKRPEWKDSDFPDAEGRFAELSPKDLAAWLIKTRKKDLKAISGSLTQQVVFNRNEDPEYAEKMEKTRKEVYKQLGRKDLLDKMEETKQTNMKHIKLFESFLSESSETFQGNTKKEFMKWARSVFKKRNIPREKYEYWLDNVDSSPNDWDNSYKGVSQDELIDVHLKAWFDEL